MEATTQRKILTRVGPRALRADETKDGTKTSTKPS
jgi:hypothetical protein